MYISIENFCRITAKSTFVWKEEALGQKQKNAYLWDVAVKMSELYG